jgi:hypothetical protein
MVDFLFHNGDRCIHASAMITIDFNDFPIVCDWILNIRHQFDDKKAMDIFTLTHPILCRGLKVIYLPAIDP